MHGRILGIDYGTKRVGIAIADPLAMFAQPLETCSPDAALERIRAIQTSEGVERIVIGWPLLPDGSEGASTERVEQFINRIVKVVPSAEIVKWDERGSTREARDLIKSGAKPSLKSTGRERIDTAAAGLILQQYLDDAHSP